MNGIKGVEQRSRGIVWTPLLALGLILAGHSSSALADTVKGQACVIDGDTLSIGGKRAYRQCRGGVVVHLYGVDAPELQQPCKTAKGGIWKCGLEAGSRLLRTVAKHEVVCEGRSSGADGSIKAICSVGGADLGEVMVSRGYAFANARESRKYVEFERRAKDRGFGIWQAGPKGVMNPATWRDLNNR